MLPSTISLEDGETAPLFSHTPSSSSSSSSVTAVRIDSTKLKTCPTNDNEGTPLPKLQFGVLCLLRILDPLNFTQIFPYINQLLIDLRVTTDPKGVGMYSGVVESVFALSQLLAIYPWGYMSDVWGRRPAIIAGCLGLALSAIAFGFSESFLTIVVSRALAGLFSGNVAVIPAVLCEITNEKNQAVAFPFFGLWWPLGVILGPLIGGTFANAASKYPSSPLFNYPLLKRHKYILPSLIVAAITFASAVLAFFFLDETSRHPSKNTIPRTYGTISSTSTDSEGTIASPQPLPRPDHPTHKRRPSSIELYSEPAIRAICLSSGALGFITTAFDVVFVLFCFSPIESGGLAFSDTKIGFALASSGLLSATLQLFFMPSLLRRYDHARLFHTFMSVWPCAFLALPLLHGLAKFGATAKVVVGDDGGLGGGLHLSAEATQAALFAKVALWIGVMVVLAIARVGYLAHSLNILLIKACSKSELAVGSTNGLLQIHICLAKGISPALISAIFTLSIAYNVAGGYFWAIVMAVLALGATRLSRRVVDETDGFREARL